MKPKLKQVVYVIDYDDLCINKETVLALGENFFIPCGFQCYLSNYQMISFEKTYARLDTAKRILRQHYLKLRKENKVPVMKLVPLKSYCGEWWAYEEANEKRC